MTGARAIRAIALSAAALLMASAPGLRAQKQSVDTTRSTLTVYVYKSGLFSAFADNHVIKATVANGSLSNDAPAGIELSIRAADLKVLDPNLSPDRRAEVQARMTSPQVLDVDRFPTITFASTTIKETAPARWSVTGRLAVHGQTRDVTFPVRRTGDVYAGEVTINQRDYGIEPIRIAGGAVKVKDEVKIAFEIVSHAHP
jgi:hypothetical protein